MHRCIRFIFILGHLNVKTPTKFNLSHSNDFECTTELVHGFDETIMLVLFFFQLLFHLLWISKASMQDDPPVCLRH
jgi:hypothetical protein